MDKTYYVYEWYIVKTGEIFYVGQGKNDRCTQMRRESDRTKEFFNIYYNNECNYRIIYNGLTQEESWELEEQTISKYRELGYPLVNVSDGGKHGPKLVGNKNPMYGISPKERMDEETYNEWLEKQKHNKQGEKNPNYGKHTLHKIYTENPELAKEKQSRPGAQNGKAKKITLYDNGEYVNTFGCIKECAEYLYNLGYDKFKVKTLTNKIPECAKNGNLLFDKFTFKFEEK